MSDLSTLTEIKDGFIGFLAASVLGLLGLIRRQDIGEINRRQAEMDERIDKLETRLGEAEKELIVRGTTEQRRERGKSEA